MAKVNRKKFHRQLEKDKKLMQILLDYNKALQTSPRRGEGADPEPFVQRFPPKLQEEARDFFNMMRQARRGLIASRISLMEELAGKLLMIEEVAHKMAELVLADIERGLGVHAEPAPKKNRKKR